jgi:hypothetical protein
MIADGYSVRLCYKKRTVLVRGFAFQFRRRLAA